MIVPALFLFASLAGLLVAFLLPGWSDLMLVAAPAALASLYLLLRDWHGADKVAQDWVILDGSNVMHWRNEIPDLDSVRAVLAHVSGLGMTPGVVFDANAGYLLFGRHHNDRAFSERLGLPLDRVMVVPKGTPADPFILTAARDLGARIVTNDRFRDWAGEFPEVQTPGHLLRGGFREGRPWLDLGPEQAR
ncbi:hypothetical protein [Maritimibacter sp. HL-12]|jgi:hypothetical protein|uniref:NYN domain-containing protein n=1 Tax=Maritimibacter sp. HL-12 TaxID=1162418 RepID=UPI000A0F02EF|nr:hypothetical protein [Maritimibacter sp. HL-12]SMH29629.1 Zc3h12a-like Ribonuclease NYN domain-containing protein [Maritimibacter sp. HL-12]